LDPVSSRVSFGAFVGNISPLLPPLNLSVPAFSTQLLRAGSTPHRLLVEQKFGFQNRSLGSLRRSQFQTGKGLVRQSLLRTGMEPLADHLVARRKRNRLSWSMVQDQGFGVNGFSYRGSQGRKWGGRCVAWFSEWSLRTLKLKNRGGSQKRKVAK